MLVGELGGGVGVRDGKGVVLGLHEAARAGHSCSEYERNTRGCCPSITLAEPQSPGWLAGPCNGCLACSVRMQQPSSPSWLMPPRSGELAPGLGMHSGSCAPSVMTGREQQGVMEACA